MDRSNADFICTTVRSCARCGCDHGELTFMQFVNPVDNYRYWAECPITREPILLGTTREVDGE